MAENDIIDDGGVIKEAEEKKPLGEQLLEKGALSEDQLRIALFEQQSSGDPLGRILVRLGFVTEATIRDMLSETGDAKVVDLRNISVDPMFWPECLLMWPNNIISFPSIMMR